MLEYIHNNYQPGVTELYVVIPIVLIVALVLYFMVKKER